MMEHKKNFRYVIIAHLIGVLVLGAAAYLFKGNISKGLFAGIIFSLLLQLLIYRIKPELFNNKKVRYPH